MEDKDGVNRRIAEDGWEADGLCGLRRVRRGEVEGRRNEGEINNRQAEARATMTEDVERVARTTDQCIVLVLRRLENDHDGLDDDREEVEEEEKYTNKEGSLFRESRSLGLGSVGPQQQPKLPEYLSHLLRTPHHQDHKLTKFQVTLYLMTYDITRHSACFLVLSTRRQALATMHPTSRLARLLLLFLACGNVRRIPLWSCSDIQFSTVTSMSLSEDISRLEKITFLSDDDLKRVTGTFVIVNCPEHDVLLSTSPELPSLIHKVATSARTECSGFWLQHQLSQSKKAPHFNSQLVSPFDCASVGCFDKRWWRYPAAVRWIRTQSIEPALRTRSSFLICWLLSIRIEIRGLLVAIFREGDWQGYWNYAGLWSATCQRCENKVNKRLRQYHQVGEAQCSAVFELHSTSLTSAQGPLPPKSGGAINNFCYLFVAPPHFRET